MDAAAERAAVEAAEEAWGAAVEAHDVDAVIAFFEADGLSMPPDGPVVQGEDARRAWLTALFAAPDFDSTWETGRIDISAAGDYALSIGTTSHAAGTDAQGQPLRREGKYVTVWHKVDGEWKVAADIWNASAPTP
ncbi:MAG: DUF4440 domain-containing protein [Myxococcota bacterium]